MVMEVLIPTAAIRNLIREDKIHQIYSAMQTGTGAYRHADVQPEPGATPIFQKQITLDVALARSSNPDELQDLINRGVQLRRASGQAANAPVRRVSAAGSSRNEEVTDHAGLYISRSQ